MAHQPVLPEAQDTAVSFIEISEDGNASRRTVHRPIATFSLPTAARRRVLVVEDGLIVAEDTRRRLEALGYSVVAVVSSGEAAIQAATQHRPDLVLMDVHLHGPMDGIQAADVIRRTLNIPVVFATAYSDDQTLQRAKAARPFGFIVKPLHPRELRTAIEMALNQHEVCRGPEPPAIRENVLLDAAPDGILQVDEEGTIRTANARAARMLGRERSDQICSSSFVSSVLPSEREQASRFLTSGSHEGHPETLTLLRPDGTLLRASITASAILPSSRAGGGRVLVLRSADAPHATAPQEHAREGPGRDVHQRVHSSLAFVSSLLSLQTRYIEDESTLCSMRESRNRVRAVALIFKHLSHAGTNGTLDIPRYVRDLAAVLKHSSGPGGRNVTVTVDCPQPDLAIDKAFPCGLILHELLSAAVRRLSAGRIDVSLRADQAGALRLEIMEEVQELFSSPEGPGLFSLELVRFLAEQMRGTVEQTPPPNKGWVVVFPS
jgi:CheY-like chemotaxis protein/two-component sensor histidine kinase